MGDCRSAAPLTDLLAQAASANPDWLFDRFDTQPAAAGQVTMTKPTLAVVGHGMVGHHFLEQCVSRNLHLDYQIVVFGEERYAAYDRVHLSEYFAGRSAESLSLVEGDFLPATVLSCGCRNASRRSIGMPALFAPPADMKRTGINWCWQPDHIPLFRR